MSGRSARQVAADLRERAQELWNRQDDDTCALLREAADALDRVAEAIFTASSRLNYDLVPHVSPVVALDLQDLARRLVDAEASSG